MLVGLNGRKQAGKDTVYERLRRLVGDTIPVERAAFADLMYDSGAAALGVAPEQLREWRNNPHVMVAVVDEFGDHVAQQSVRSFIQRYGTEGHRDVFGEEFWVNQMNLEHEGRILVVTDTRMVNEAEAIRRAGGVVVSIVGPEEDGADGHATEAPLPNSLIDIVLPNTVRDDDFRTLDEAITSLLLYLDVVLGAQC